jgi:hypothetical protein
MQLSESHDSGRSSTGETVARKAAPCEIKRVGHRPAPWGHVPFFTNERKNFPRGLTQQFDCAFSDCKHISSIGVSGESAFPSSTSPE